MFPFSGLSERRDRRRRMHDYQIIRHQFEALSDADLADMGLKRFQLGHAARAKFFG